MENINATLSNATSYLPQFAKSVMGSPYTTVALGCGIISMLVLALKLQSLYEEMSKSVDQVADRLQLCIDDFKNQITLQTAHIQLINKATEVQTKIVSTMTFLAVAVGVIALLTFVIIPFYPMINFAAICTGASVLTAVLIPTAFFARSERCFGVIKEYVRDRDCN